MSLHVIRRGLDIPIAGEATGIPVMLDPPATIGVDPREFSGVVPKLAVRPGDPLQRGSVLFFDKKRPQLCFRSPVAGRLAEVQRGARRVITAVVVERDGDGVASIPKIDPEATPDQVREWLVQSGLWFSFRTRPFDNVPDPDGVPQGILVHATNTGPLQPSAGALLQHADRPHLQLGLALLAKLTPGKVYLTTAQGSQHPALSGLTGVEIHQFSGPHPSGDPAVQVNYLQPPTGSGQLWVISAWEVVRLGQLAVSGEYPNQKVYAAVGAGLKQPRLVRTLVGAPIAHIVGEPEGPNRYLRGSVLTGSQASYAEWGGYLTSAIHVLPQEVKRFLHGWALPRLDAFSAHRAFWSGFLPSKLFDIRPGLNGGYREQVPLHSYRRVIATPDIEPEFLLKAMQAGDLIESVNLGMLDLSMEEAALCTFVCPSKLEYDVVLRKSLERYQKEA